MGGEAGVEVVEAEEETVVVEEETVGAARHLDVRLRLALLVLEGAVEEEDARLLDAAAHLAVDDVLVEHDALEHARVLDVAARDLLDLGVPVEGGRGA